MWVDAGPGSLAELLRHVSLSSLDAVWISHLHLDHVGDLLNAYYALAYGELPARAAPLPVFAPAGLTDRLTGFFGPGFEEGFLDVRPLSDGHVVHLDELTLLSRSVDHGGPEAYALRVSVGERVLAYSGDCTPCAALDEVAVGADVLLCEANDPEPNAFHHTPAEAGALARRTGAHHLVVTHVGPLLTPESATEQAASAFGGPTTHADLAATFTF
ncbi:MBL fold metallo-hydrolase [Kribbella sp. CA-247076]|uniref:MBL fold metallo-hydrolase n=1 Tax=Kribbella sp. CA-247076 TaxID=3239941 RepID=UPI003D8F2BC8